MSRIGNKPIPVPANVTVDIRGREVTVASGGKQLALTHRPEVTVRLDEQAKTVVVERANDERIAKALHGLTRSLIANMVEGVANGFTKELEIVGIGYNVKPVGQDLEFQLGFANAVTIRIPEGVKAEVIQPTNPGRIAVTGCDKQHVGQIAAQIRAIRPPEPYLGKGIRYSNEVVRRKAGKAFVGAG